MYLISLETVDSSLILSVCTGWQGIPHVQDSSIIPVTNLVKKERKETREDQDEIISKLQRDDVTIYYQHLLLRITSIQSGIKLF